MTIDQRLLPILLLFFISPFTFAQETSDNGDARLASLYNLQNYYISQLKKEYISDTLKYGYKQKLAEVETQITDQYQENIKRLQSFPNTDQLVQEEKKKQEYRAIELEMLNEMEPSVYAHELNTWNFYGGVGFGGIHYSAPLSIGIEKVFSQKISGGLCYQRFSENIKVKEQDDSLTSYIVYISQYKYYYNSINLHCSYHLTIPSLNFEHFDVYATALLGYNLASHPKASIEADEVAEPSRKGINVGVMGGIKYMIDSNVGFYSELGYSRNSYFNLGIVYRLIPASKRKEKAEVKEVIGDADNLEEEQKEDKDENTKNKTGKKGSKKEKNSTKSLSKTSSEKINHSEDAKPDSDKEIEQSKEKDQKE